MVKTDKSDYMQKTLRFYEDNADEYIKNTSDMKDHEWLERFSALLPPGGRVLDIGCAGGRDSQWFAEKGFEVFGIDFSPLMIERARAAITRVSFSTMNILELEFPQNFFDGIWCSCVLIHLSKTDVPKAFEEMRRVLRVGGVLYLLVKQGEGEGIEKDKRYGGAEKYSSYFTEQELKDLFRSNNFELQELTGLQERVDSYRAKDRIFMIGRRIS